MTRGGLSPLGLSLAEVVANVSTTQQLLAVADFLGWQEDGNGGRFQLWTLKKPIGGGHPIGTTLTRETILGQLKKNYGAVQVPAGVPVDFQAVDSPGHG